VGPLGFCGFQSYPKSTANLCQTPALQCYKPPRLRHGLQLKFKVPPTYPLRPVTMSNTRPPRITATAGTELVGTVWRDDRCSPPPLNFKIRTLHPYGVAGSDFRPLSNIPHCCPFGSGPISVPRWLFTLSSPTRQCAWDALTAPTTPPERPLRRRLDLWWHRWPLYWDIRHGAVPPGTLPGGDGSAELRVGGVGRSSHRMGWGGVAREGSPPQAHP